LRVQDPAPFRLRWSLDDLGIHWADIIRPEGQQAAVRFTFFRPEAGRWEERDFKVDVASAL